MIRVFMVDRIRLACEAVAVVFGRTQDLAVVGFAQDVQPALTALATVECNLILVNANLRDGGSLHLLTEVRQQYPEIKVIVVGLPNTEAVIMRYIEAGAIGYTLLEDSLDELLMRIRAAFNEEAIVAPEVAVALIDRLANLSDLLADVGVTPEHYANLTDREGQILELIADGLTNQEIAEELTIEVGTVKNHIHSIFDKLNLSNRKDAAIYLSLLQQHEADEDFDSEPTSS
jgi:DNA-binding NarL/FixJ family response regulator